MVVEQTVSTHNTALVYETVERRFFQDCQNKEASQMGSLEQQTSFSHWHF